MDRRVENVEDGRHRRPFRDVPVHMAFVANVMEKKAVIQWFSWTTKIEASGTTLSKEYRMPTPVASDGGKQDARHFFMPRKR